MSVVKAEGQYLLEHYNMNELALWNKITSLDTGRCARTFTGNCQEKEISTMKMQCMLGDRCCHGCQGKNWMNNILK